MVIIEAPDINISDRPAVIAGLGSCRLYQPLQSVFSRVGLNLAYWETTPFMYSAGEAIQYLEVCLGDKNIPDQLRSFVFSDLRPNKNPIVLKEKLLQTDLYVVEISTLDQLVYDGLYLNWNEVGHRAIHANIPAYMRWWHELTNRELRSGSPETVEEIISGLGTDKKAIPDEECRMLSEARFETLSREGLTLALFKIVDLVPNAKWLFVSHLNVASQGEKMLPHRKVMLDLLTEAAAEIGQFVFDPTPIVEDFGYRRALESDGNDTQHYTAEFKPVLGMALYERIRSILMTKD